jgi:dipeptidyl aminopeptidase/acylaminoacyl peptidase
MSTAKISGKSFSADEEKILFTSDVSGILNAHEVQISNRSQRQLTHSLTDNICAVSYFPNDARILISKDRGDRENSVLCVLEPDGKEIVLTPADEVQAFFHRWSFDQRSFYVSTNERDPRRYDLYKFDAQTFERTPIYQTTEDYHFAGLSGDEKYVLFIKAESRTSADIFLYDIGTGEMKCITPGEDHVLNCAPVFDRDDRTIYYVTNKDSDFRYLQRLNLTTGETQCVERANGDVAWAIFSPDFRRRITFWDDCTSTLRAMKIHDLETGVTSTLPGFSQHSITSAVISKSGRRLAFYAHGDRSPGNIYVYDFETEQITQVTESLNPAIDRDDLVESEMVSFQSFDGLEIPCLLWRPHGASEINKVPALVWVHGGPGGRMAKGYKGRIQYLINHGYAVLGLNYRGSSGFGKKFFDADHRKHGREPLWDCLVAKEYLARLGYVDKSRIGIIGASFGGYMVLAALAFHPDEFAAGVNICGISNLVSLAHTLPKYWDTKRFYEKLGDPEKDDDLLRAISPFFHAGKIRKPLLMLQGANDPRCPREQSDEMVGAIRRHGGTVEYLVYEDEAHGFRKRKNAVPAYEAILNFLDAHLKPKAEQNRRTSEPESFVSGVGVSFSATSQTRLSRD